jgi:predicted ATP-dependent endonuclease of OLD family
MLIKDVEITGFWGHSKASASFFSDVTIFIGLNGTGKTTFINLISAVLTVDLLQLSTLQFDQIVIKLVEPNGKGSRKITVTNTQVNSSNFYKYKVGTSTYNISLGSDVRLRRVLLEKETAHRFMSPDLRLQYLELKQEMGNLVEISQISVYRQVSNDSLEVDPRQRVTAVDERLQQLFERFSRYQLKLETQLNERSTGFQQEALGSLLYSEDFDEFNDFKLEGVSEIDIETQEDKLLKAFKELGINDKSEQISMHISKLRSALQGLTKSSEEKGPVAVNDVFALPLIYRTNQIIDSLSKSEEDKRRIVEPRQRFFDTIQKFMRNKKFEYNNKRSALSFSLENASTEIFPWSSLSSGEKQLLIQFMEVILQEGRSLIFIADEPELSLHVAWQEKLLTALRDLNENAQLIVATHSPDIVADFSDNVIDMESVIHNNVQ